MLNRTLLALEKILLDIAGASLLVMMAITVIDVILRYIFSSPLAWSQEVITLYLMVALFFGAITDTYSRNIHVRIVAFSYKNPKINATVAASSNFAMFIFGLILTGQLAISTWESIGDTYIGYLDWPMWIQPGLALIGIGLLTLRFLVNAVIEGIKLRTIWSQHG